MVLDVETVHVRRVRHSVPDVQSRSAAAAVPGPQGSTAAGLTDANSHPGVRDRHMHHLDLRPHELPDLRGREPEPMTANGPDRRFHNVCSGAALG
jgi:hypothetical protein